MKKIQLLSITSILISLASSSAFAGAQPIISYGHFQGAHAVPTLSGTMLIVLSLLLVAVAVRITKQKGAQTRKLFMTLVGVTALVSGFSGVKLISTVDAVALGNIDLSLDGAGPHDKVFHDGVINTVTNTSSNPVQIFSINHEFCTPKAIANECKGNPSGTVLAVGAECFIDCTAAEEGCFNDADCNNGQVCNVSPGSDFGGQCVNPNILVKPIK